MSIWPSCSFFLCGGGGGSMSLTKTIHDKWLPRIPLLRLPSVRSQLRASNRLEAFLRDHQPDIFQRTYVQCFPPGSQSLAKGRSAEKLYNFMDVSITVCRLS